MALRCLGLRAAYALLIPVACYFLLFAPRAMRASMDYLARVGYGGRSWFARAWSTYKHFFTFGQLLLDRVAVISGGGERFGFRFEGEHHMRAALGQGQGLILVTAHLGNWEVAAQLLPRLDARVNVVAFQGEAAHIRRYMGEVLRKRAFSLIELDGSADASLAIMSALSRNEIVAIHADRCLDDEGAHVVSVPLLGTPARFPAGPHIIAAVSGAPIVHTFALRESTYRYHFIAYPADHLRFSSRKERGRQIQGWVRCFAGRLDANLREHPLQWGNFYHFWARGGSGQRPG